METTDLISEFHSRIQRKRENMPSADDCPWPKEQYECYREGLLQGYMWAEQILNDIIKEDEYDNRRKSKSL